MGRSKDTKPTTTTTTRKRIPKAKSKIVVKRTPKRSTKTTSSTKKSPSKRTPTKRVKKVWPKKGQKKDTPIETAGIYIFYSTLLKEMPDSEMAEQWLMEHGCFDEKKQEELFEKYSTKTTKTTRSSPTRRSPPKSVT